MVTFSSALCASKRASSSSTSAHRAATTMQPNGSGGQVTPTASTCLAAIRHGHGAVLRTAILTDQLFLVDRGTNSKSSARASTVALLVVPAPSNTLKWRALKAIFSMHAKMICKCTAGTLPQRTKLRWNCRQFWDFEKLEMLLGSQRLRPTIQKWEFSYSSSPLPFHSSLLMMPCFAYSRAADEASPRVVRLLLHFHTILLLRSCLCPPWRDLAFVATRFQHNDFQCHSGKLENIELQTQAQTAKDHHVGHKMCTIREGTRIQWGTSPQPPVSVRSGWKHNGHWIRQRVIETHFK